jgi:two-component system, response regulator PdtaR
MTIKVALAEDEPDVRQLLRKLLENIGYEVCCAVGNGVDLLESCRGREVDVVLVDLDMPVLDGLATAEELAGRGLPVVLVSGHPDLKELVLDAEPLITALAKPVTASALEQAVELAVAAQG